MSTTSKYLSIVEKRSQEGKTLEKVYRNLRSNELLEMAYMKLYGNKGAMTPGTNPNDSIDGMSRKRIQKLHDKLRDGQFVWTPVRRTYIKKSNGKLRPLGIPNWEDKIVQEAMRLILQAYYEPQFRNSSHGFRTGRGCHSALQSIKNRWTGVKWFIEGDIKGCFDNINHEILLEILGRSFKDNGFIDLVRRMLQAGYLEERRFHPTYSGTPQGGIVSPILSNIYMNEFDALMEDKLIPLFTKGKKRKLNPEYMKEFRKITNLRKTGEEQELREAEKELRTLSSQVPNDPDFRRLKYVRYADDFLLGFIGPKEEAEKIKDDLTRYLCKFLNLELSAEKTLITHASTEQAHFLGYVINVPNNVDSRITRSSDGKLKRATNGTPMLRMPKNVQHEWIRKYTKDRKPTHRPELLLNSDYDIVMQYKMELTGLYNYYSLATNVSRLGRLQGTMLASLVKTLASKHKTKTSSIYKKHMDNNKEIRATIERIGKKPLTVAFGKMSMAKQNNTSQETLDYIVTKYAERTELLQRLQADTCELCGSTENVEVHHIRALKDITKGKENWQKRMSAMKRKTLVVCTKCHDNIHAGRYDGQRLTTRQ